MSTPGAHSETAQSEPADSSTSIDSQTKEPWRKRRKLSQEINERPKAPVFIRPAPVAPTALYQYGPSQDSVPVNRVRPRTVLNSKRSSALNLRNYPSNQHPTGIAIWILQKIEQMRRDRLESPASASHAGAWSGNHNQSQFVVPLPAFQTSQTSPAIPTNGSDASSPQGSEEYDAARLQSQRDRKTKQRLENWVKNKENDVVARAKIEARKKFTLDSTEVERQEWIEQRIKEDLDRLLNRIAGQLHRDIAYLGPFQIGYAEYYFNPAYWPPGYDTQILTAGKLLANIFPALTENTVTPRSDAAARALIKALGDSRPSHLCFYEAIRILSENPEVLEGVERVLTHIFTPKSSLSLPRKRSMSNFHTSIGVEPTPVIVPPQGQPVLHWKEPATIENAPRPPVPPPRSLSTSAQYFGNGSNSVLSDPQNQTPVAMQTYPQSPTVVTQQDPYHLYREPFQAANNGRQQTKLASKPSVSSAQVHPDHLPASHTRAAEVHDETLNYGFQRQTRPSHGVHLLEVSGSPVAVAGAADTPQPHVEKKTTVASQQHTESLAEVQEIQDSPSPQGLDVSQVGSMDSSDSNNSIIVVRQYARSSPEGELEVYQDTNETTDPDVTGTLRKPHSVESRKDSPEPVVLRSSRPKRNQTPVALAVSGSPTTSERGKSRTSARTRKSIAKSGPLESSQKSPGQGIQNGSVIGRPKLLKRSRRDAESPTPVTDSMGRPSRRTTRLSAKTSAAEVELESTLPSDLQDNEIITLSPGDVGVQKAIGSVQVDTSEPVKSIRDRLQEPEITSESLASFRTSQLRSSGRERKPTAKALALSKTVSTRKRSASPADTAPAVKIPKTTAANGQHSSAIQVVVGDDDTALTNTTALQPLSARPQPGITKVAPDKATVLSKTTSVDADSDLIGQSLVEYHDTHIPASDAGIGEKDGGPLSRIRKTTKAGKRNKGISRRANTPDGPEAHTNRTNQSTPSIPATQVEPSKGLSGMASAKGSSKASGVPYALSPSRPSDDTDSSLVVWAAIAAEWNDSEDEETEDTEASSTKYVKKVMEGMKKYEQRRRPLRFRNAAPTSTTGVTQRDTRSQATPTFNPYNLQSAYEHFQRFGRPEFANIPANPGPAPQPASSANSHKPMPSYPRHISTGAPNPISNSQQYNVLPPTHGHTFQVPRSSLSGRPESSPLRPLFSPRTTKPREQEIADKYHELMKARNEARTRGLQVRDDMGLEELNHMIRFHDTRVTTNIQRATRPSIPSPASVVPMNLFNRALKPDSASHHFVGPPVPPRSPAFPAYWPSRPLPQASSHAHGSTSVPKSSGAPPRAPMLFSTRTSAPAQHVPGTHSPASPDAFTVKLGAQSAPRSSNGLVPLAPAPLNKSTYSNGYSFYHRPQTYFAAAREVQNPLASPLGSLHIAKTDSEDLLPGSASNRSTVKKPPTANPSKFRIDPRGLNGEKPGGGTIINASGTQDTAKERGKQRSQSHEHEVSSGRATPDGSAAAAFKKGGLLMNFGQL